MKRDAPRRRRAGCPRARAGTLGAVMAAMLLPGGARAVDMSLYQLTDTRQGHFLEPGQRRPLSGVGVGQMACRDFNGSVQRLESDQDDGLYFAFVAWRDGFITAATRDGWRLALVPDDGETWLRSYCGQFPEQRFARAVAGFVRQMKQTRMAQQ